MADSYAKEKQLENSFLNNLQPSSTSIDTLASLKALQHFYPADDPAHTAISEIAREEARWQVAGMQALRSSRMLQEKFGLSMQSAAICGQLVKQKLAQSVYDEALTNALNSDGVRRLNLGTNARELLQGDSLINR